jgi:hypothetical protein
VNAAPKVACLLVASLAVCCTPPLGAPWEHPTPVQWEQATAALDRVRAMAPRSAYVATVTTTLRNPRKGWVVDGRGAIAIAPGRAVRMILVGAAGATLLDAWVTRDRWRIAVPPIESIQRGDAEAPKDSPVRFFRWWFFAPFGGVPYAAAVRPEGSVWLLRDGEAVTEVRLGACGAGPRVSATRRDHDRTDRVDECRAAASGQPGPRDSVHYEDQVRGLRVDIEVESVTEAPSNEDAFRDPDDLPGGG